MALVVGADVAEIEPLGLLEVGLDRRHLPRPADRVARLYRDLRPVERAAAFVEHDLEIHRRRRPSQDLRPFFPVLVAPDRLPLGLRRQFEVEVGEPEVAQEVEHEPQRRLELAGQLLLRAEDVRVVLGHPPHAGEPVHDTGALVAIHGTELEKSQRQVAVRAQLTLVDEDVERAVHRLQVVPGALVELHRREHPVGKPLQVT